MNDASVIWAFICILVDIGVSFRKLTWRELS